MTGKVEGLIRLCKALPKGVCNQIPTFVNLYVPSRLHWCREGKCQQGDTSLCSIVLVVVSVAEPNHRYSSPISGRAECHSLSTYETMKLCKRSMMGEVERPIGLCQMLSMF